MITNETYTDIQILQNHDFEVEITFDALDIKSTDSFAAVIALDKEHTEFQGPKWGGSAWSQAAVYVVPLTIIADQSADTVTYEGSSATEVVLTVDKVDDQNLNIVLTGVQTAKFSDVFEGVWDLVQKDTSGAADVYTRQVQGDVVVSAGATRLSDTFTASVA